MADNDVKLQFFANAAAAEKAIVGLEKKFADMENRLKQTSKASKKSADESKDSLDTFGRKIDEVTTKVGKQKSAVSLAASHVLAFAAGYAAMPALIGRVVDAQRQLTKEADETAIRFDRMFKKTEAQAGRAITAGDKHKITSAAQKFAIGDLSVAEQASRALMASGFSAEDATGEALNHVLGFLKVTNKADFDPTAMVKAAGLYMSAQGIKTTPENLKKLLVAGGALFEKSQFQAEDLQDLAGKSTELAGRMSVPEQLAALRVVEGTSEAANATTALKIFGQRLTGAATDKNRVALLRKIGLKPEDVDMLGESGVDVMKVLGKAIESLPEAQRAGWSQQFFGAEASGLAQHLLKNTGLVEKTIGEMTDELGYQEKLDRATSGISAASDRQKIRNEVFAAGRGGIGDLIGDELESTQRETSPLFARVNRWFYDAFRGVGFSPETSAGMSFGASKSEMSGVRERVESMMGGASQQTTELKEQTRVLKEIRDQGRPRVNRNAQGEGAP